MNRRDFFDPKAAFLNPDFQARLLVYARFSAGLVILIGVIPLIGWMSGVSLLTSLLPTLPSLKPMTALEFILIGLSLLAATFPRKRLFYLSKDLFAFLVTLISCVALYEFFSTNVTMLSVIIDNVLARSANQVQMIVPPTVSILFITAGLSVLFLDIGKKKDLFQYFVLVGAIVILPSIIEHFYGIDFIYGFADNFFCFIAIKFFCTLIPISYCSFQISSDNRVI